MGTAPPPSPPPVALKSLGVRDYRAYIGVMNSKLGFYWDNGQENGNYRDYRAYIGVYIGIIGFISCLYGGCIGIMEKEIETTI